MAFRSEKRLSSPVVPFLLLFGALLLLLFFTSNLSSSVRSATFKVPDVQQHQQRQCPIILYNKQFKTGSTVISNVLFRTSEAYGCRNADCKMQVSLMNGTVAHIGAQGGLTMSCHAHESNHDLITNLRTTHGNNFIYLASIREPVSWFKSAASFFYKQRGNANVEEMKTEQGFKAAVDWALEDRRYRVFESMLFRTLGLSVNASRNEILDKFLMYDLIIDNSRMDEGLADLGKLTGWDLLPCTDQKTPLYRGDAYNNYRVEDIRNATIRTARLYQIAVEVRDGRQVRPLFAAADTVAESNQ